MNYSKRIFFITITVLITVNVVTEAVRAAEIAQREEAQREADVAKSMAVKAAEILAAEAPVSLEGECMNAAREEDAKLEGEVAKAVVAARKAEAVRAAEAARAAEIAQREAAKYEEAQRVAEAAKIAEANCKADAECIAESERAAKAAKDADAVKAIAVNAAEIARLAAEANVSLEGGCMNQLRAIYHDQLIDDVNPARKVAQYSIHYIKLSDFNGGTNPAIKHAYDYYVLLKSNVQSGTILPIKNFCKNTCKTISGNSAEDCRKQLLKAGFKEKPAKDQVESSSCSLSSCLPKMTTKPVDPSTESETDIMDNLEHAFCKSCFREFYRNFYERWYVVHIGQFFSLSSVMPTPEEFCGKRS